MRDERRDNGRIIDLAGAVYGAAQPAVAAPATTSMPRPGRGPSRQGKHGILIHVEPEMARRLKHLAVERDTSLQALGVVRPSPGCWPVNETRGMRTVPCLTVLTRENRKAGHRGARAILVFGRTPGRAARFRGGRAGEAEFT